MNATPESLLALLPIGVALTAGLRTIIGVRTLGTFTSSLLALMLLELGGRSSAALLLVCGGSGLIAAAVVERLRIERSARLGIVVVAVCTGVVATGVADGAVGVPIVILALLAERTWVEATTEGVRSATTLLATTVLAGWWIAAVLDGVAPFLTSQHWAVAALIGAAVTIGVGSYRGLRLSEIRRFRRLLVPATPGTSWQ